MQTCATPLGVGDQDTNPTSGDPLSLTTADGRRCSLMGGATYTVAGLRANYSCNDGATGFGSPDRSARLWTLKVQASEGADLIDTPVAKAWF